MAYTLAAFIAGPETAAVLGDALGTRPVALAQGLELVPVRRALPGRNGSPPPSSSFGEALWWLTADAEDAAARAARNAPVAYVEAEYFGGAGEQHAVTWRGGPGEFAQSELPGAINQALAALGVRRVASASGGRLQDEFDSVGLGRHRSAEEWAGL
jgi:hypothetical protein